jgi:HlyD family secretion protein
MTSKSLPLSLLLVLTTACHQSTDSNIVVANGYVEATEVRVATKIGGTLARFSIDEGDELEIGDELAQIDTIDLELALDAALADSDLADAALRLLETGYRSEEVDEAAAVVGQLEAELAAAERDLERFQALLDRGSGVAKTRDDALARRDAAADAVAAARHRLSKLQAGFRPEEIDQARAQLAAADARIAQLEQQIRDATVRSPVPGVVTETLVERGELVPAGTVLAVITDLDDIWLTAYVGALDLGRIRLGQEAEVLTDDGQRRTGHLSYISPRSEFTPKNVQTRDEREKLVYQVRVRLDNADRLFKDGMPATAQLSGISDEAP